MISIKRCGFSVFATPQPFVISLCFHRVRVCFFDERKNKRFSIDCLLKSRVRFIISQWHFDARQSMKVVERLGQEQQCGAVDWFE